MTNQEPGAPEPLTSEEERAFRAEIAALKRPDYDSFKGRVGRLLATLDRDRAALSHPESDTRDEAAVCTCHVRFPNCSIHGYPAHPESDTRGLDVAIGFDPRRVAAALAVIVTEPGDTFLGDDAWSAIDAALGRSDNFPPGVTTDLGFPWNPDETNGREATRLAAEAVLAAPPDLSIDREGLTAHDRTLDALSDLFLQYPSGPVHDSGMRLLSALDAARLAAIRGTTQPEPTE